METTAPPRSLSPTVGERSTTESSTRFGVRLALAAILLLAAILRLHGLAHESLWFDEALTVIHVRYAFPQMLASVHLLENMPPFYFCCLWFWVRLFGTSDFSVRFPSVIFGVASVWMIFQLARRMLPASPAAGRDRFALLAAFLLAISRWHIAYCQQARVYSLMLFLLLLCCDCFLRLIQSADVRSTRFKTTATLYVLVSAAMLWAQPFSGFSLLAQNLFFGLLWVESLAGFIPPPAISMRQWLTFQGAIAVLFAPWLPHMQEVMRVGAPWMHAPHIIQAYLDYSDSTPLRAALLILIVLAMIRGIVRREPWVLFAFLLATLPVFVPVLASSAKHPLFIPRYGMPAIIGLYLLAAGGAAFLGPIAAWIAAALLAAVAFPHLADDFAHSRNMVPRPDVRDAAALIDRQATADDGLIFEELLERKVFSVYTHRSDWNVLDRVPNQPNAAPHRIWFVAATGSLNPHGGWIAGTPYVIVREWHFTDLVVAQLSDAPNR